METVGGSYRGPFHDELEKKYSDNFNAPDRNFKAIMSFNPDRIIAIATELRGLQKEYEEARTATKQFEATNPTIAKILEPHYWCLKSCMFKNDFFLCWGNLTVSFFLMQS